MEVFPFPVKINLPEAPRAQGELQQQLGSASPAVPGKCLALNETEQAQETKTLKGSSILYISSTNSGFIPLENHGVLRVWRGPQRSSVPNLPLEDHRGSVEFTQINSGNERREGSQPCSREQELPVKPLTAARGEQNPSCCLQTLQFNPLPAIRNHPGQLGTVRTIFGLSISSGGRRWGKVRKKRERN